MSTIFLDRDGVINENRSDYVKSWQELSKKEGGFQDATDDDGFPGWNCVFDYILAHRECLSVDHYTAEVAEAVKKAAAG